MLLEEQCNNLEKLVEELVLILVTVKKKYSFIY